MHMHKPARSVPTCAMAVCVAKCAVAALSQTKANVEKPSTGAPYPMWALRISSVSSPASSSVFRSRSYVRVQGPCLWFTQVAIARDEG
jgi:hypothetical protein